MLLLAEVRRGSAQHLLQNQHISSNAYTSLHNTTGMEDIQHVKSELQASTALGPATQQQGKCQICFSHSIPNTKQEGHSAHTRVDAVA
jgi:hypothetical protein